MEEGWLGEMEEGCVGERVGLGCVGERDEGEERGQLSGGQSLVKMWGQLRWRVSLQGIAGICLMFGLGIGGWVVGVGDFAEWLRGFWWWVFFEEGKAGEGGGFIEQG